MLGSMPVEVLTALHLKGKVMKVFCVAAAIAVLFLPSTVLASNSALHRGLATVAPEELEQGDESAPVEEAAVPAPAPEATEPADDASQATPTEEAAPEPAPADEPVDTDEGDIAEGEEPAALDEDEETDDEDEETDDEDEETDEFE